MAWQEVTRVSLREEFVQLAAQPHLPLTGGDAALRRREGPHFCSSLRHTSHRRESASSQPAAASASFSEARGTNGRSKLEVRVSPGACAV
jgi:hypothetical protein